MAKRSSRVQFEATDKQTKCEKKSGLGEGKREWARPRFGCRSGAEAKLKRLISQRKPRNRPNIYVVVK